MDESGLSAILNGYWYLMIFGAVLTGFGAAAVGGRKGYNFSLGFLVGLLFMLAGLLVYALLPDLLLQKRLEEIRDINRQMVAELGMIRRGERAAATEGVA